MIISMSDILCVTNRLLCAEKFLVRIDKLASAHPAAIILREKDLPENAYCKLAGAVLEICQKNGTLCILHNYVNAAKETGCGALHLPLPLLCALSPSDRERFAVLGTSCHSPSDAVRAEQLGCTYLVAGHVFDTDCKRGLPGRGLAFLREVVRSVSIPVYAIGGICAENISAVRKSGAAGACVMSGSMKCEDVRSYLSSLEVKENDIP